MWHFMVKYNIIWFCSPVKGVACRKSVSFQIFVVAIPKEGLAGQPFFCYDTDCRFIICSLQRLYKLFCVIQKEGLARPRQICKGGFCDTQFICLWSPVRFVSPVSPGYIKY